MTEQANEERSALEKSLKVSDEIQSVNQTTLQQQLDETLVPNAAGSAGAPLPEKFGRYEIRKKLGQGAMGSVYLALDTVLDREVALKIPKFGPDDGPEDVERFYREARAMATLHHPNLCAVYDVGEHAGTHYLCMAYIKGRSLQDFLQGGKAHPSRQVAAVLRKIAVALEEAHQVGVVHRDLKPANIMIDKKGEPVIMDFGLAHRQKENETTLTQAGQILGTPAYMAPEQVDGDHSKVGPQSDVYALGVICYEMLTGKRPFQGTLTSVMVQILTKEPETPSSISPKEIDAGLEQICLKAMSKSLNDRYKSAGEMAKALRDYLKGDPQAAEKQAAAKLLPAKPLLADPATEAAGSTGVELEVLAREFFAEAVRAGEAAGKSGVAAASVESASQLSNVSPAMSSQAATQAKSPAPKRLVDLVWYNRRNRITTLASGGGLVLLLGVIVLLLPGKKGTMRIEIKDPEIEVSVKGTDVVLKGADTQDVTLSPGEHVLHVKRGDFEFDTQSLILKKGETAVVNVEMLDGGIEVASNGRLLGKQAIEDAANQAIGPSPATLGDSNEKADVATPRAVAPFDLTEAKKHQKAWANRLGVPVEVTNSLGMKFVLIPPGEFVMGSTQAEIEAVPKFDGEDDWWQKGAASEAPRHKVVLTKPFYFAIHEVTQSAYRQVIGNNPSCFSSQGVFKERVAGLDTSNFPVENVNWNEASEFCEKLSRKEGLEPFALKQQPREAPVIEGNGYRLPTEAEWEFACRAGTTTQFWSGDHVEDLSDTGWNGANSGDRTHEVSRLKANPFGLFDIHGNVWEWVHDRWNSTYYEQFIEGSAVDPWGPVTDDPWRGVRGGFWGTPELRCASARRYGQPPDERYGHNGFRVVLSVDAVRQNLTSVFDKNRSTSTITNKDEKRSFASDQWIDVILLVDPKLDKMDVPPLTGKNEWTVNGNELVVRCSDNKPCKLLFPVDLEGKSLECEFEFTRRAGDVGFNIDIPADKGPCPVIFDYVARGQVVMPQVQKPFPGTCKLVTGERTAIRMRVLRLEGRDEVELWLNDKSLGTWNGNRDDIAIPSQEGYPHGRRTGFWIPNGEFVFHKIRLRMLGGGRAETLRTVPNAPSNEIAPSR